MARLQTAALMLALSGTISVAHANPAPGSVSYVTKRSCAGVDASTVCDGSGPGQTITDSQITGGVGLPSNSGQTFGPGDTTAGQVTFGGPGLPVVTGSVTTSLEGDWRLNANELGYFFFTNSGASAEALPFTATFAYANSSVSPASSPGTDGGTLPGGVSYNAFFAVADPSLLDTGAAPIDLFNTFDDLSCGTGVFAAGLINGDTAGGGASRGVGFTSCSASPFLLAPGQTVLVVDGFQIPANRGGFIDDASLTLSGPIPEPAGWALLLISVFGLGTLLRRGPGVTAVTA